MRRFTAVFFMVMVTACSGSSGSTTSAGVATQLPIEDLELTPDTIVSTTAGVGRSTIARTVTTIVQAIDSADRLLETHQHSTVPRCEYENPAVRQIIWNLSDDQTSNHTCAWPVPATDSYSLNSWPRAAHSRPPSAPTIVR